MGEVYLAFDPGLDRTVALKTIRPDGDNPTFLDRLYREAKACGRLRHPGIVTVYDIGEIDGTVFIAMEHLEGENLGAAIANGRLSFEQKVRILIEILDALEYAHRQDVVHRDIKPSNIHLLRDGHIKLLDFGLARVARAESLTKSAIMGTPYYMSPEQLKGQKIDGRSDIFSTGVLAYELFTHRRAFDGNEITTVMLKVLSEEPPPMETAWSAAFPEIEKIVARAIAKNADDRFATAEDMKNAFAAFLASSHAAIAKAQADVTIRTDRALLEARTLMQQGQHAQTEHLLAETLRLNPDARDARALYEQVTHVLPPAPRADVPGAAPTPAPPRERQPAAQASAPARGDTRSTAVQPSAPLPDPQPPGAHSGVKRGVFLGAAAAVVLAAAAGAALYERGAATPDGGSAAAGQTANANSAAAIAPDALPATASPSRSAGANTAAPDAPNAASAASSQSASASPRADAPPSAASNAPPSNAQGPGQQAAAASSQIAAPARAANARGAVQIDAAGADAALASALAEALKAKDVPVQTGAPGATLVVRAQSQIQVRQSPFQGTSALTADYTGTLQLRDTATNSRQTLSFDGHAMEFGDAVVRQAAIRALADQMAEAIRNAFHN
jgi:serine/threonine-protein kinase